MPITPQLRLPVLMSALAAGLILATTACDTSSEPTPLVQPPVVATPGPASSATVFPTAAAGPQYGGILRQMGVSDPVSFDAHVAASSPDNVHNAKLYNNLVWNPNGNVIEPDVAQRYEITGTGQTVTYFLRRDVRFHDGTPLTARDVKFSLEKIMGLVDGIVSPRVGTIKEFVDTSRPDNGIEIVDQYAVRLHLVAPAASLNTFLATGFAAVMPEGITAEELARNPGGSGPYRIKSFERGAMWEYERNNDYFKSGLPYLDGIQVFLSRSFAASEAAFITGRVELNRASWSQDNGPVVREMEANGQVVIRPYSTFCGPQGLLLNTTIPPFDNPRLREAINLALDRKAYIEVVHNGNAEAALYLDTGGWGLAADEIWQLPGFRQPKDQDIAEARVIMAQEYPDGLRVTLLSRNSGTYPRQAEFFTGELAKIGIDATVTLVDRSQLYPTGQALNYQIMSYYFCLTTGDPDELFGGYFISSASRNWLGYSNPQIDRMYLEQSTELDLSRRREIVRDMERIILKDLPIIPTAIHNLTKNHYAYVKDVPLGITSYMDERLEKVWKDTP